MKEIPLGSINSKIYEKHGELYYKLEPIIGLQTQVFGDFKVSAATVIVCNDECFIFKVGRTKIKMAFKPFTTGLEKVCITKYILGFIPFGRQFCEISVINKKYLFESFTSS